MFQHLAPGNMNDLAPARNNFSANVGRIFEILGEMVEARAFDLQTVNEVYPVVKRSAAIVAQAGKYGDFTSASSASKLLICGRLVRSPTWVAHSPPTSNNQKLA